MGQMLERRLDTEIPNLSANDFQNFVEKLMKEKHQKNFTQIKAVNDNGNDGIINKNQILACYGPESVNKKEFERKAEKDYQKFKENHYPDQKKWTFVINREIMDDRRKFIEELKDEEDIETGIWGVFKLKNDVKQLTWTNKYRIAKELKIDDKFIDTDLFEDIVKDINKIELKDKDKRDYPDIEEKIRHNFDQESAELIEEEYYALLDKINSFQKRQSDLPQDIGEVRSKISGKYRRLDGDFETKFNNLLDYLCKGHEDDDVYCNSVKAVLLYYFNSCLIGENPEEAK